MDVWDACKIIALRCLALDASPSCNSPQCFSERAPFWNIRCMLCFSWCEMKPASQRLSHVAAYESFPSGAIQRCPHHSQPKNGRILCDSLFSLFCAPQCAPDHVFAFPPAVVYVCNAVTGSWYTYPAGHALPWPDCVKKTG